jgi:hypothetical protein
MKANNGVTKLFTVLFVFAGLTLLGAPLAQAGDRYVIKGGEVYDTETNLTWQRCSVGMRWVEGLGCKGVKKLHSFAEAQKLANGNWRVPKKDELASLIDKSQSKLYINQDAFPDMADNWTSDHGWWYWSSTVSDASNAFRVAFVYGLVYNNDRSFANAVRLVRSGQ